MDQQQHILYTNAHKHGRTLIQSVLSRIFLFLSLDWLAVLTHFASPMCDNVIRFFKFRICSDSSAVQCERFAYTQTQTNTLAWSHSFKLFVKIVMRFFLLSIRFAICNLCVFRRLFKNAHFCASVRLHCWRSILDSQMRWLLVFFRFDLLILTVLPCQILHYAERNKACDNTIYTWSKWICFFFTFINVCQRLNCDT